jgi:hypothetical protein
LKPNCPGLSIGRSSTNFTTWKHILEDLPMIIPGQFGFNCPSGFREEAFWNIFTIGSHVKKVNFYARYCEQIFDIFLTFRYVKFTLTIETQTVVPIRGMA